MMGDPRARDNGGRSSSRKTLCWVIQRPQDMMLGDPAAAEMMLGDLATAKHDAFSGRKTLLWVIQGLETMVGDPGAARHDAGRSSSCKT